MVRMVIVLALAFATFWGLESCLSSHHGLLRSLEDKRTTNCLVGRVPLNGVHAFERVFVLNFWASEPDQAFRFERMFTVMW